MVKLSLGNSRNRLFVAAVNLCALVNGGQQHSFFFCTGAGGCFFFLSRSVGVFQQFRKGSVFFWAPSKLETSGIHS